MADETQLKDTKVAGALASLTDRDPHQPPPRTSENGEGDGVADMTVNHRSTEGSPAGEGGDANMDTTRSAGEGEDANVDTTCSAGEGGDANVDTTRSAGEGEDANVDTTRSAGEGEDANVDTTRSAGEGGDANTDTTRSAGEGGDANTDTTRSAGEGEDANMDMTRSAGEGGDTNVDVTRSAGEGEDANMDTTRSAGEEQTAAGESDSNGEERAGASEGKDAGGGETESSTTDNLDETMDIGTVDQQEQEAHMEGEEQSVATGAGNSPDTSDAVPACDGSNEEVEPDVKPCVLLPAAEGDQPEDVKVPLDPLQPTRALAPEAALSADSGGSSPATAAAATNGMNLVKLSVQKAESEAVGTSPSPPLVKVKEEPLDEEYEQALISSAATASVKDEPNTAKDDLRIGSVYSVTPAADVPRLPVVKAQPMQMFCFNCRKGLVKGQTAYQRKGSPALFCSTTCLSSTLIASKGSSKICYNCQKVISRPQDVILAPCFKGTMQDFCSQNCLTSFNYKNSQKPSMATQTAAQLQPQSLCSMCSRYCVSKHEVILSGSVHKICSDACFDRFRSINNLSMAGCANCGSFYHSKPLLLKMEASARTLCNTECLAKFKENTKISVPCAMCHTSRLLADMVDNKNSDDSVSLFCSSSCVMAFMVQTVSSSGARLNCDSCGKNMVPAYHLAMSDTSIRNFCTLPCVMAFQEKFKKSPKQLNVFTKLPSGSNQIQAVLPQQPRQDACKALPLLDCSQCKRKITTKPELIQIKDKLVLVCNKECAQEFKRINNILAVCVFCKLEKVAREAKRINSRDCYFCSDGCKLLYRHELDKSWGRHCHSCSYCHCVSKRLVTAQYGGSVEAFCSEECRSKYTMLFCHVAKCDTCGQKGKLKESLPVQGDVKHFCDMKCLLEFCGEKAAVAQGELVRAGEEPTPVIANVVSLAGETPEKPGRTELEQKTAKQEGAQTAVPYSTTFAQTSSTQTDAYMAKVPPPPAPKILKNKALLCRPLVQNKGVSCKTQTVDVESQTDEPTPRVLVVPIPVPVYVPVPMNMYSQLTPKPMSLPLPLPVPMFLPVTMDSAERIVETIEEIKEKIPTDPFEAELILMAEMVAEQTETSDKEEGPKDKEADSRPDREQIAPDDRASSYGDDLDTDDLASFLNTFDDPSSDAAVRSPGRPYTDDKLDPVPDVGVAAADPELAPPNPPSMDIEADFTVEILERMARLREQSQQSQQPLSLSPATSRRRQAHRKVRDKRGRKSQRSKKGAAPAAEEESSSSSSTGSASRGVSMETPKLRSQYGVEAWRCWIRWRQTQTNLQKPRLGSRPMELKEDLLRCTTAELTYGLCCFITELKRPNGEKYSPDSLFYLCLGIQQYLFENGRVENIFMDHFYNKFSSEITSSLRGFQPSVTASGYIHSRVEEEFLWECKQLGAYSPIVLLNTLLFFCCKFFGFSTVEQHRQLSFAHVMRCTKTNQNSTKTTFLRFYPPLSMNESEPDPEVPPTKKRKEEESKEEILEMMENTENPLRCPVRLYEFYLSKCSESVKQRTNLFYLQPERCCVPNSPLWFSSIPLDDGTMEAMLTRILTVRELHLMARKGGNGKEQRRPDDPPFIPTEDDEDSE